MVDNGLSDIELGDIEFGDLLKDYIEDWSDDEDSVPGDLAENGNEGEATNVSGFIMF
jgi:hypothetical protein